MMQSMSMWLRAARACKEACRSALTPQIVAQSAQLEQPLRSLRRNILAPKSA